METFKEHILTSEELRQVQLVQLELLKEVDRICSKCGIQYNIIAGTLLGAVRHKGYIPWDDDADVALLRKEYDKFVKACRRELDLKRFIFQDEKTTRGYRWGYGKLRMKETLFLRKNQEHMPYNQGIFIDIFPLDYVSEKRIVRAVQNFIGFLIRKEMWSIVGAFSEKNSIKRLIYKFLSHIPEEKIKDHYRAFVRICNRKKTSWVRILTYPTPNNNYGYKTTWYENSGLYEFENIFFKGISDYDSYLKFKFGNYMEFPDVEDRKTHPVTKLKLLGGDK